MPSLKQSVTLDSVSLFMLCAAVIISPLLIGSVHWPVALALCAWSGVAACGMGLSRRRSAVRRVRCSLLSGVFLLGFLWCVVQLLPCPAALVELISPGRWGAYESARAHGLIQQDLSWMPLSLDPGSTADMAIRFLTLLAMSAGLDQVRGRILRSRVLLHVVGITVLVSLAVGFLQAWISPELYLGFYKAERPPTWGSTFVNMNQASALSAAGAFVWAVLSTARGVKKQRYRAAYACLAILCLGGVALQESVGVWVALVLSAGASGLFYALTKRKVVESLKVRIALVHSMLVAGVGVWGAAIMYASSERGSLSTRAEMVRAAWSASGSFVLTGSGGWSVERVLGAFMTWDVIGFSRVETIEAEVLEWALTLGWPVALMMWGGLILAWVTPLFSSRLRARRGAAAFGFGLYVLMCAQMHFPFFMLGLGLPLVMGWSVLHAQSTSSKDRGGDDEHIGGLRKVMSRGVMPGNKALVACAACVVCGGALSTYMLSATPGRVSNDDIKALSMPQVHELATWLPTEPQLYVRMAEQDELDAEQVERLYHAAFLLEPTSPYRLLWARALWMTGDAEERAQASKMFASLLTTEGPQYYKNSLRVILETVRTGQARAKILGVVGPDLWAQSWRLILAVEGELEAQAFLQALTDLRERDVHAHAQLVDFYASQKRWEMLNMYAQLLEMWELEDATRGRALRLRAQFLAARATGGTQATVALVSAQLDDFATQRELAPFLLDMSSQLMNHEDAARFRGALNEARKQVCVGEQSARQLLSCQTHSAWEREARGERDSAEQMWRALAQKHKNLDVLGAYYERQGLCTSLRLLLQQQGMDARAKTRLEKRYARCVEVE